MYDLSTPTFALTTTSIMEVINMFENKLIHGVHISRFLASWLKIVNDRYLYWSWKDYINWLKIITFDGEHLTKEEIIDIFNFSTNGKLELENSVKWFLDNN